MLNTKSLQMANSGHLSFTEAVLMSCPLQENETEPEETYPSGLSLTGCLNAKNDSKALFYQNNCHKIPLLRLRTEHLMHNSEPK